MIAGAHTIIFAEDAERARTFLRDVLEFEGVDAGDGWLIFALPPGEIAVHPGSGWGRGPGHHVLFFMCRDIEQTVEELKGKGVDFVSPIEDEGWGRIAQFKIPGAAKSACTNPAIRAHLESSRVAPEAPLRRPCLPDLARSGSSRERAHSALGLTASAPARRRAGSPCAESTRRAKSRTANSSSACVRRGRIASFFVFHSRLTCFTTSIESPLTITCRSPCLSATRRPSIRACHSAVLWVPRSHRLTSSSKEPSLSWTVQAAVTGPGLCPPPSK